MRSGFRIWLIVLAGAAAPATASQVATAGWYLGNWDCTLDGRPTKMQWRVVSVDDRRDQGGGVASVSQGAALRGQFFDRNGPWVPLTRIRDSADTLDFRHADGNRWFLRRNGVTRANWPLAEGWSTWNGQRYPLSCRKPPR